MADNPDPAPAAGGGPPPDARTGQRWRRWGESALTTGARLSVETGQWLSRRWGQVVALLRGMEPAAAFGPPPPPPGRLTERRDAELAVPAQGYVYVFHVRASLMWWSEGLRPEDLSWHAHYFQPHAVQKLTRLAADLARTLPPHRAGDLEVRLQRAVDAADWAFSRGGKTVTCEPEIRVRLDERVRRALLPYSERLVTLESEYELHLARARRAEQLARRWTGILQEFAAGPVPAAAGPTAEENVVDAVRRMTALQKIAARWVEELLRDRPRTDESRPAGRRGDAVTRQPPDRARDVPKQPGPAAGSGDAVAPDPDAPRQA